MTHDDRAEVRVAVLDADADALARILSRLTLPDHALQWLGDGLLAVDRRRRHDLEPAARRCVLALRERQWQGDSELAARIEAVYGWGPTPLLRPLPVDLEDLAGVLEGDPLLGGGRIDLRTGEVWPQSVFDDAELTGELDDDEDDDERWLGVWCQGSRAGYRDMQQFIDTVADPRLADRLARAIRGRGAFRRFKDVLDDWPDLLEEWYAFADDRQRGRARAWLAGEGFTPTPRAAP